MTRPGEAEAVQLVTDRLKQYSQPTPTGSIAWGLSVESIVAAAYPVIEAAVRADEKARCLTAIAAAAYKANSRDVIPGSALALAAVRGDDAGTQERIEAGVPASSVDKGLDLSVSVYQENQP